MVQFKEIKPKGGRGLLPKTVKTCFLDCDTVVLSTGSTPDTALSEALKGKYMRILRKSATASAPGKYARQLRKRCGPLPRFD